MASRSFVETEKYNAAIAIAQQLNDLGFWVLDTETTGLDQNAEIIEIGIADHKGQEIFHTYSMPNGSISNEATAKNGLSMEILQGHGAPSWSDVLASLADVFAEAPATLLIHNKGFDLRILKQNGFEIPETVPVKCSLELSRAILGNDNGALDGDHTAIGDCLAVVQRIRQFASTPLLDYPDIELEEASYAIAQIEALAIERSRIAKREELLKNQVARLLARTDLNEVASATKRATLTDSWTKVRVAEGHTIEQVIEAYPDIVKTEPQLKPSAGRSLPKIIQANGGKLPECLAADHKPWIKLTKVK